MNDNKDKYKQFHAKAWCAHLQPNSMLKAEEVAELFGYASAQSLFSAHDKGRFPNPDKYSPVSTDKTDSKVAMRAYWRYDTVLKEARRRERLMYESDNGENHEL